MPAERTMMRQVREVLRLRTAGVGRNEIARRVGVAPSTVRLTLKRLATAGLSWPLPAEMTDSALETALFAAAGTKQGHRRHVEPDWAEIHRELSPKLKHRQIGRRGKGHAPLPSDIATPQCRTPWSNKHLNPERSGQFCDSSRKHLRCRCKFALSFVAD